MTKQDKRLILVELNEINFDVVKAYVERDPALLPAMARLLKGHIIETTSETKYEELEPWIQWVSVHTGKTYSEHGVFRLGDITETQQAQIFEHIEDMGLQVGALSPMNARNALKRPAYFVPDPWTKTSTHGSMLVNALSRAISQAVNDNAQSKITLASALSLVAGLLRFAHPRHYVLYLSLMLRAKGAPWCKALVLDLLLHDLHSALYKKKTPHFSTLFLNAGAHIQHHYFFNASPIKDKVSQRNPQWYVSEAADPVLDMLKVYDKILGELLGMRNVDLLISTGLSQVPYDRVKYYYRLKQHAEFLTLIGVRHVAVQARMTRDFLIEFESPAAAAAAEKTLAKIRMEADDVQLFGDIDNRGGSLFVTLTYPHEIREDSTIVVDGKRIALKPHVVFVAIKNGMHQGKGFTFFTPGIAAFAPANRSHVSELHYAIRRFFGELAAPSR